MEAVDNPVVVVNYDLQWPLQFERVQAVLRPLAAEYGAIVEHVGSTAVPGLAAKPILDIAVVTAEAWQQQVLGKRLLELGYAARGELGIPGREAFAQTDPKVPLSPADECFFAHHLYVVLQTGIPWRNFMLLRECLRTDSGLRCEYGNLKQELARKFGADRAGYTEAKSGFILRCLARMGMNRDALTEIAKTNGADISLLPL